MKVNYKKFWDNAFPFVTGIVILIICIALKGGTESFGKASSKPIVLDSVSIKELNLEEGNTETVIIRETGTGFTKELNYLIESHPNFEVITVTREVEGNPLTTKGYKVILKANKRGLEGETSFLLNKILFLSLFFLYYVLLYLIEISMWGIILGILTFIILVVLHELGHFTAAKKSGVHVKEFGLGIPPRAKTLWKDKSGTAYTLNWIPLGGFVVLKGEDGTDEKENMDPDCFIKAKLWKKLIIIVAGVAMNFLTAWVLFTIAFSVGMQPMSVLPDGYMGLYSESYVTPSVGFLEEKGFISEEYAKGDVIVKQVIEGSIAQDIGLEDGTKIVSINGEAVSPKNLSTQLSEIQSGEVNNISYQLAGAETTIESEFVCGEPCVLGVMYDSYEIPTIKFSVPRAMREALKEIKAEWNLTMDNLARIGHLIGAGESKQAINSLSGPVAIVKVGQLLFDNLGFLSFLGFAGMISVALAIMNILPIPALDGGRFWALIIQKVFRFKEDKFFNIEAWVDTIFFWCLMLMGIIIILKDLSFRGINIPFLS